MAHVPPQPPHCLSLPLAPLDAGRPQHPNPVAKTTFLSLPLGSSRSVMTLPPALAGAGPRRGSMPLPIKHQLVRASAVDELDSPPSSPEVSSHGGASPAGGRGPYKVMLLGESRVGKTTLAAIFGGMKGVSHPEEDHAEDSYERRFYVDDEEVTLTLYDIWDQGDSGGWMQESCLQTGDAFLVVFSVTDRRSFTRVPPTLLRLRAGSPRTDPPIILVGNKSDLARSREVSREVPDQAYLHQNRAPEGRAHPSKALFQATKCRARPVHVKMELHVKCTPMMVSCSITRPLLGLPHPEIPHVHLTNRAFD
uniref:GTP-binding protein REM 2 n=1 Tax=Pseudonaja textilis TaxID=8673 RepID=A0A670YRF6_PSETE